jgi:anti-sigma factor RsiW
MSTPQELISDYFDGTIDADGAARLSAWLSEDPVNARELVRAAMLHQGVRDLLNGRHMLSEPEYVAGGDVMSETMVLPAVQSNDISGDAADDIPLPSPPTWVRPRQTTSGTRRLWSGAAAAAILLTIFGIWVGIKSYGPRDSGFTKLSKSSLPTVLPEPAVVARLMMSLDAKWNGDGPAADGSVRALEMSLASGLVKIQFANGVDVIVQGPARFHPRTGALVTLLDGKLTALVPPDGRGFSVRTATATIIDLGTEFGVAASRSLGTNVEVFRGEIELASAPIQNSSESSSPTSSAKSTAKVGTGGARHIDVTGAVAAIAADPSSFVRKGEFDSRVEAKIAMDARMAAWRASLKSLSADPSLRILYTIDEPAAGVSPDSQTAVLKNHAAAALDRWDIPLTASAAPGQGPGRWPATHCMLFDANLRQRLILPDYPPAPNGQMTVSAWVYARSRRSFATVAKNWADGLFGQFYLGLGEAGNKLIIQAQQENGAHVLATDTEPFPLNSWVHVAAVIDGTKVHLYRDGKERAAAACTGLQPHPDVTAMAIGFKISNDGINPSPSRSGFWDGSIDELAIFHRALSATEIKDLYEVGCFDAGKSPIGSPLGQP